MAFSAEFYAANISIDEQGHATMTAHVRLKDSELGDCGTRTIQQDDPAVVGAVLGFIAQMLPTLESKVSDGVTVPVSLPSSKVEW